MQDLKLEMKDLREQMAKKDKSMESLDKLNNRLK
jgi:hypothetical protein